MKFNNIVSSSYLWSPYLPFNQPQVKSIWKRGLLSWACVNILVLIPQATECKDHMYRIHAVLDIGHQEVISRTGRIRAYPLPFGDWSIVGLGTHMDFWTLSPLILRDNRMSSLKSRNKSYFNQALYTDFPLHIPYFYVFFSLAHKVLRWRVTGLLLAVWRHKDAPLICREARDGVESAEIPLCLPRAVAKDWMLKSQDPFAVVAWSPSFSCLEPLTQQVHVLTRQNDNHPHMSQRIRGTLPSCLHCENPSGA